MDDLLEVLVGLGCALTTCSVPAFVVALWLTSRIRRMEARLADLEVELATAVSTASVVARAVPAPIPVAVAPEVLPTPAPVVPTAEGPEPAVATPEVPTPEVPTTETPDPEVPTAETPEVLPSVEAPPPVGSAKPAPVPEIEVPPRPALSPERVAVWVGAGIGGLMLVLGALLVLQVVWRSGWFGPGARTLGGAVAASAALVFGRVMRGRLPVVASALVGVGLGVTFGVVYAAHVLYGLIGASVAFGLLAASSGVSILWGWRHDDRYLAWLGLAGAFMAPWLVSSGEDRPWFLFSYLFLVLVGGVSAATARGWWDVVLMAGAGAAAIHTGWGVTDLSPERVGPALYGVVCIALPFARGAWRGGLDRAGTHAAGVLLGLAPVLATPWLIQLEGDFWDPYTGVYVDREARGPLLLQAAFALLAPALAQATARRREQTLWSAVATAVGAWTLLVFVASLAGAGGPLTVAWALPLVAVLVSAGLSQPGELGRGLNGIPLLAAGLAHTLLLANTGEVGELSGVAPAGALVLLALAVAAGTRSQPALYAGLLGVTGMLWIPSFDVDHPMGWAALALVFLVPWSTVPALVRWEARPWLGGAAAALAPILVFPPLYAAWDKAWDEDWIGVLPALLGAWALVGGALWARRHAARRDDPTLALFVLVAASGVAFAIPLQVRERWWTLGWAIEGATLALLARLGLHGSIRWVSSALALAVGARVLLNPWALSWGDASGLPIFNWTLYTWGVPLACTMVTIHALAAADPERRALITRTLPVLLILAVAEGFALVNVEVSHAFQDSGPIELSGTGLMQGMVRSLAWGLYGMVVLGVGLALRQRLLRLLGFAVVLLAAAKVFLVDLWMLEGLIRVGSVLGLGVFLLVAAFLFERLVLRDVGEGSES